MSDNPWVEAQAIARVVGIEDACPEWVIFRAYSEAGRMQHYPAVLARLRGASVEDVAYGARSAAVVLATACPRRHWRLWSGPDPKWPGYRVVYIETPKGQVSWHIPEDWPGLDWRELGPGLPGDEWDGVTHDITSKVKLITDALS